MNSGTVSSTLTAPTLVAVNGTWATVQIINNATAGGGTLVYAPGATTLAVANDSTLPPGYSAPLKIKSGIATIAMASSGGAVNADIQEVEPRP